MRIVPIAVLLLGVILSAGANAVEQTDRTVATFVFVGELISIEELPDPCRKEQKETGELSCIIMDSLYRAKYRIVLPVAGDYPHAEVTFDIADHYGFPPFAYFKSALLFVGLYDDGPWLHKYQAIPMHRTADGQWASCGEVKYRKEGEPTPSMLRDLRFETEIEPAGDANALEWIELVSRWKKTGGQDYEVKNGTIRCKRGILLPDAYDIVRNGVMKARGVPLPALQTSPYLRSKPVARASAPGRVALIPRAPRAAHSGSFCATLRNPTSVHLCLAPRRGTQPFSLNCASTNLCRIDESE